MSISTSGLAKELKTLFEVDTNAQVLEAAQEMKRHTASLTAELNNPAVVVAVRWRRGESARIAVLQGEDTPMRDVAEALRAGQVVLEQQMEQIAMQAQSEAARLRAQLAERTKDSS